MDIRSMLMAADQDADMNSEDLPLSGGAGRPPSPVSASAAAPRPQQPSMAPQHAPIRPGAVTPASPGPEMGYQIVVLPVGGELKYFMVGPMEKPQSFGAVVSGPLATTTVSGADDDGPGSSRRNQLQRLLRALRLLSALAPFTIRTVDPLADKIGFPAGDHSDPSPKSLVTSACSLDCPRTRR